LESPDYHRTPHQVQEAQSSTSITPAPVYPNLPANLAQRRAALLPLQPTRTSTRQSSVAPAPNLAPAIVPAPVVQYHYLPPPLARARAALPPLVPLRGRENNTTAAPQSFVCLILLLYLIFIY
jgi:hypothetical protein